MNRRRSRAEGTTKKVGGKIQKGIGKAIGNKDYGIQSAGPK